MESSVSFDNHASAEQLAAIRGRARWFVWWSGLGLTLAALFGGLLAAGLVDWLLRLEDVGLRVLLAVTVWGFVGWTLWTRLWAPMRASLSDPFVAGQVDRRYPGLAGRCQTAAEFAASGCDPRWGSSELQALVIQQAQADLCRIEPEEIVAPRGLGSSLSAALVMCLLGGVVLLAYPLEAATAVRRLVWPWGQQPWPQATILALFDADGRPVPHDTDDPLRAVRGETLRFLVDTLRGPLPDQVWWEVRTAEPSPPETQLLTQEVRDLPAGANRRVGVVEWTAVQGPLEFRAVGGDDRSMPWRRLLVVEPPTIADFEVTVTPPAYSGLPTQTLPTGATQIRGLIGSQVTIQARATKPLKSVSLAQREQPPQPLSLGPDAQSWTGELTITQPGTSIFWFVLHDRQGFREQQPLEFELRGEIDALPEVLLTEPDADRLVTPDARVPLAIEARDDRGLTQLRLAWQRGDTAEPPRELAAWSERPLQSSFTGDWPLAELDLKPGDRIVFRAEALDACDLGEPHIGKSAPCTLLIVSPQEKSVDLAQRVGELLEDLRDAARQQARLRQQATELETQLEAVGELRPEDRDLLNRLQFDQRRLNTQLSDSQHGLGERARRIRREFGWNGLQDDATEPLLDGIAGELEELSAATLPRIDQDLTEATKRLDQPEDKGPEQSASAARQALEQAARGQQEVLETLQRRQEELAEWQSERELSSELQALIEAQRRINETTAELGAQTISKALAELSPQQLAELGKLSARQRQQADRLRNFRQHLERQAQRLEEDEPARAAELAETAEKLVEEHLDADLRQAADDLAANRIGTAGPLQQRAEELLSQLEQSWSEQRPDDAEQLVERLKSLQEAADQLAERAEELRKQSESESQADDDRELLRKQSEELRRDAQRLERQLDRLRQHAAAESARNAAQELRKAEAELSDEDLDDPEQLRKHLAQAQEELQQLQEQLEQDRRQAEARLLQEEFLRIAAQVEALKIRQEGVIAETVRLETQRQESGRFTRGQLRSLQDLTGVERELAKSAAELRDQLTGAVVVKAALDGAVRSLERATARLNERQTDAVTQRLEQDAAQRLARILTAWNRQPDGANQPGQTDEPMSENDQPQQSGPPGEAIPLMVQVALLRELQADCLDRTVALEEQRQPDGTLAADLAPLLSDVAEEQGQLLTLAKALLEQLAPPATAPQPGDQPPLEDN
jgi:hypothetical protein